MEKISVGSVAEKSFIYKPNIKKAIATSVIRENILKKILINGEKR